MPYCSDWQENLLHIIKKILAQGVVFGDRDGVVEAIQGACKFGRRFETSSLPGVKKNDLEKNGGKISEYIFYVRVRK